MVLRGLPTKKPRIKPIKIQMPITKSLDTGTGAPNRKSNSTASLLMTKKMVSKAVMTMMNMVFGFII